jgi:hypothetical protein
MRKFVAIALGVALAGVGTVALASRNSSGTHTLPAGNPVTPGTSISTTWANNTLGDISQSLTDSLDRNGKGGMLSPLRVPNGSLSAPTLSWTNDTDTGLYLVGDANPAMTVAGTQRQAWTSTGSSVTGTFSASGASTLTGNTTVGGTLGVTGAATLSAGATMPNGDLALSKTGEQAVTKSGGSLVLQTTDASTIAFRTNSVAAAYFDAAQNLNMQSHLIGALATPTAADHAATKGYVDARASTAGKIVAGGIVVGTTGAFPGGFGATVARTGTGTYTVTLSTSYAAPTPVVGAAGAVTAHVSAAVVSGTELSVRTWTDAGVAADRDFSIFVVAGP